MSEPQKIPVMVRLPQESVDLLDEAARVDGRSRSGMARLLLERSLAPSSTPAGHTKDGKVSSSRRHALDCSCFGCKPPKAAAK